jgi:hypothetical protein
MVRTKPNAVGATGVTSNWEINPDDPDDPHYSLPRDSDGLPIFLILPSGEILPTGEERSIRASYERRLKHCERGWFTTKDPAFIAEALISVHLHRQPIPLWLTEALVTLVLGHRTKSHATRALDQHSHWMRFEAVRAAKEHGLRWLQAQVEHAPKLIAKLREEKASAERVQTVKDWAKDAQDRAGRILKRGWVTWEEAKELAAEALAGTGAKADAGTVFKSYERVKRDLKEGRGALYLVPKVPRTTLAEAPAARNRSDSTTSVLTHSFASHGKVGQGLF